MKIRTGDTVAIISGKDKGKQGRVLRVLKESNRVVVEGVNMRVRHIKRTQTQAGQRVTFEASLSASNVMILDPKTKKPTRVAFKVDEKGKKRIAVASGEVITKTAAPKVAKATKEAKVSKDEKKDDAATQPAKQPFWKRGSKGGNKDGGHGAAGGNDSNVIQTAHRAQGG